MFASRVPTAAAATVRRTDPDPSGCREPAAKGA
ncbi:MAG: hypothetical protein JWN32_1995 [Solirubrobacterales bacterium]|nr:hypothetical protein [Solirubrobacterales bacterium]